MTKGYLEVWPNGPKGEGAEDYLRTESSIALLFHGYNVSRKEGREKLMNLANHLLAATSGAVVAIIWPGDSWAGFLSYPFEGKSADDTAKSLSEFIDRIVRQGVPISIVTHSLGGRVGLETLKALPYNRYSFEQACLMAPALDDFSLADFGSYRDTVKACTRVAVLWSKKDLVLKYSYPVGDLLQAFIYDEKAGFALGYNGPRPSREGDDVPSNVINKHIPDERKAGHGHYIPDFMPGTYNPRERKHRNQNSAANYANDVIGGKLEPDYP